MQPDEKAKELAIKFCSPSDVFKPNIASIRNATKCVSTMIDALIVYYGIDIMEEESMYINYWRQVKDELEKL